MGFALLKEKAHALFEKAGWVTHIENVKEYELALKLMDELINDYEYNRALIEVLSVSIERWENKNDAFKEFNKSISKMDAGVSLLRVLMDQHKLGVCDLPEIGSKSLVSKILNNKRRLTIDHVNALSKRFHVSPAMFFNESGQTD